MVDHRLEAACARLVVEFLRSGRREPGHVARRLDHRHLHAETDAEIGDLAGAGEFGGLDLSLGAALAETAGHEDRVKPREMRRRVLALEDLGIDPFDIDAHPVRHAAMHERFLDRLVGILELDILADDGHVHRAIGVLDAVHHILPHAQVWARRGADLEHVEHRLVEPFAVIGERGLVDRLEVVGGDHVLLAHVAEESDLLALLVGDGLFGAAHENVRRDPDALQLLDRMLRRLGLELARGGKIGQQRQMHEKTLPARPVMAELPDRLEEGQPLDIAHGAADLAQHEIDLILADREEVLDLVGDVRNDLDRLAEIVAAPLALEHVGIDPSRRDRVCPPRGHAGEAFVMAEVEIGLGPVIGDEHLAMLERRHGAGIDIEIGVELSEPHREAARLQQSPQCRRGKPLAEARDHAAGDEDVTRHAAGPRDAVIAWSKPRTTPNCRPITGFNP